MAHQGCPGRGVAGLPAEPAGAIRPPGDWLAHGVEAVVHRPLKRRLKLCDFVCHVLLEGCEADVWHGTGLALSLPVIVPCTSSL